MSFTVFFHELLQQVLRELSHTFDIPGLVHGYLKDGDNAIIRNSSKKLLYGITTGSDGNLKIFPDSLSM